MEAVLDLLGRAFGNVVSLGLGFGFFGGQSWFGGWGGQGRGSESYIFDLFLGCGGDYTVYVDPW